MAEKKPQNFANHTRLDPAFHFFLLPVAFITFALTIYMLVRDFNWYSGWRVIMGLAGLVGVLTIRLYALKVQDRVIRLEERLRLASVLPESMKARIDELTEDQFIGLRFASDSELPVLVEKTLANGWSRKEIKQAVNAWRPDYFRV